MSRFSTCNLYLLCVQKRYRNFRRHPYSHCFLQIWHLYLRSKLLLLAYCCQLQVCCYWATVPQCRVVPSGTTTVKSDVESTATGVLCHDVVQYHLIPPPVEFVVKSTTTCILCHDVVQSGTTTGRVCCQVYCYREYRRTVSWCIHCNRKRWKNSTLGWKTINFPPSRDIRWNSIPKWWKIRRIPPHGVE